MGLNPFHSFPVIYWNTVQYGSASGSLISSRYWPQQWTDLIWLESGSPCKAGCLCGTSQWVYPLMPSVKRLLQSSAWIHKPQEFYQLAYFSCPLDRGACTNVCGLCLCLCVLVFMCACLDPPLLHIPNRLSLHSHRQVGDWLSSEQGKPTVI